jgi:hypothetical protein
MMMARKTNVPALIEEAAIATVTAQAAKLLSTMNASHETLAAYLRDALRRGDWSVTTKAIEWAEHKGDWLADSVLRAAYAEMDTNHKPMSDQLRAFGQRAVLRPPVHRGKGRDQYADWTRNIGVCCLVLWTCAEFGIHPTRSRSARRERIPSGISLVKRALERHGINLDERTIQEHIWFGLPGALARAAMGGFNEIDQ